MKKVFALLAIVGFVACNNAETPAVTVDSAAIKDSLAKAAAATDSTVKVIDSTVKVVDSTKKAK